MGGIMSSCRCTQVGTATASTAIPMVCETCGGVRYVAPEETLLKDAAMFLKMFISRKTDCTKLKAAAADWLKRNGLEGSIVREDSEASPAVVNSKQELAGKPLEPPDFMALARKDTGHKARCFCRDCKDMAVAHEQDWREEWDDLNPLEDMREEGQ